MDTNNLPRAISSKHLLRGRLVGLLVRGFSGSTALAFTKNGFFYKTFGRAPPEEPEPESEMSPTKQP